MKKEITQKKFGKREKTFKKGFKKDFKRKKVFKKEIEDFSAKNTVKWIYKQNTNWDFGFVDTENNGVKKWYYVFAFNKLDALDWDEVLAEIKSFKWKDEAVILKVLKRTKKILVWEFSLSKDWNYWFVVVNDEAFKKDIFIPWKMSKEAKNEDIVWLKITKWEWKNPTWEIIKILWKKWDKKIDVEWFILEAWFKADFSFKLEKEANKIQYNWDLKNRKDLRNLFTFTIDWEDAKDLDDAISIEKLENWNYKLFVHIADVCHYVTEKSNIDIEALERWISVYLADRVLPMLPKNLSNNLCSLNSNTDKLTLTCEMIIWKDWKLKSQKVYESVINSNFRLTYKFVEEIINSNKNFEELYEEIKEFNKKEILKKEEENLLEKIKLSKELKIIIWKDKEKSWVLNFDFPETKLILDENYNVVEIKEYPRYESNKIIEEFMVMANEAVSREFSNIPFLYRIHDLPSEEDFNKLQTTLNIFWIKFVLKKWDTKDFSNLLDIISTIEEKWKKMFLEKMVLRTLSKAIYTSENVGHFGLGLDFYSHFTSPIRRYPDLQIHRIIKEKLSWKLDKARIAYYKNILEDVALRSSEQERKAEKLEYKVRDYFIVKFYKSKVWEVFDWVITTMMPKWFFVQLPDTVEWFVELNFNYSFNDELQEFKNKKTWKTFRIWDELKIRLIEADEKLIRLNFEIEK